MSDLNPDASTIGQIALLVSGALAGVAAWWHGRKNADTAPPPVNAVYPPDARYFFDGPIAKVLDSLQGIYRNSVERRQEATRAHDELRGDLADIMDRLPGDGQQPPRRRRRRRP